VSDKPLEGRVALVTGASRGLGYETALAMATAGAHVVAVARTTGGLEELDDAIRAVGAAGATLVPADLTEPEIVPNLAKAIEDRWGQLDVLVSNAGFLGRMTPLAQFPPAQWSKIMALNVGVNLALIQSFEALLLRSSRPRAVFVTALGAKDGLPFAAGYGASKAALDTMVRSWANEHAKSPLRANLIDPGPMRTKMRAQAFPGEDPGTVPEPSVAAAVIRDLVTDDDETTASIWSTIQGGWIA
jgi:NAD(P)-dependent dehydrogenase (short-subunit alcohol dehydrogenase family)